MDKAKLKKASPIVITLVIALAPQVFTFCDNRAKAYEIAKAAKEARLEAQLNGKEADSGYKVLMPAIEELQALRQRDRTFMLEQGQRIDALEDQCGKPKAGHEPVMTVMHDKEPPPPEPAIKLPENLAAAHKQEQRTIINDLLLKRR